MQKKKRIRLKVASPCKADWESMTGDEAIRFCGLCQKNVYQISNMTTEQVEELLSAAGEKKCGRFYQRKDGTLVTADCSVGLKRKRRKQAAIGVSAGVLSVLGVALSGPHNPPPAAIEPTPPTTYVEPVGHELIMGDMEMVVEPDVEPEPEVEPEYVELLGEIAIDPEDYE
jgi:hypothetical protein